MRTTILNQLYNHFESRLYNQLYWSTKSSAAYINLRNKIDTRIFNQLQRRLLDELEINLIGYLNHEE